MNETTRDDAAQAAQSRYATVLDIGTRVAFLALLAAFALYVSGLVPAAVALADLPGLWRLSAREFHEATQSSLGWAWVGRLTEGESLNLAAVSLLILVVLPCHLAVWPLYRRAGDRAYTLVVAANVVILVIAACGIR